MKLQEYKDTMDSVNVPHGTAMHVLSQIREAEIPTNEISLRENKHKVVIRWTSAVAAVLVLAIALAVILSTGGNDNSFILKAGAAEISADGYVSIGDILSNGSSMGLSFDSYADEDTADTGTALLCYHDLQVDMAFAVDNITYEGENIEQVTYTIHGGNGYFSHGAETGTTYYIKNGEFCGIYGDPDSVDALITDASEYHLYFAFCDDTGRFSNESYLRDMVDTDDDGSVLHHIEADDQRIFAELFEEHKDEIYMDVTATFTDGTAETQRLTFDLVQSSDSYTLQAKLAD